MLVIWRYSRCSPTFFFLRRFSNPTKKKFNSIHQVLKSSHDRGDDEGVFHLFDQLVQRNQLNITSLLTVVNSCARSENLERGRQIERWINQSDQWRDNVRLQTSLIDMFMRYEKIDQAERIFQRIRHSSQCDIFVYNGMLKGFLRNHQAERCFPLFDQMPKDISPDNITYILLLNVCTILRDVERGVRLHQEINESLPVQYVHLQNALIDFYGKIRRIEIAEKIFHQMTLRETSSYNSLMKSYLINEMPLNVLELFEEMKENHFETVGPIGFKPDLITFMAVCDACEKLGLLLSPDSTYKHFSWKKIFSKISTTIQ